MFNKLKKIIGLIGQSIAGIVIALVILILIDIVHTSFLDFVYNKSASSPLYIPSILTNPFLSAFALIKKLFTKTGLLLLILGIYISFMGLFFNICEIYYSKKRKGLSSDEAFLISTRKSIRGTKTILFNFLVIPIGIVLFLFFVLGGRGCSRLEGIYFYNRNKELFAQGFLTYLKQSLLFHFKVLFYYVLNIIVFFLILASPIIIIRILWTFGFWGSIGSLVLLSNQIAHYFHVKAAVPIFSIILTLMGVVISLLGFLL
ncbi:MAG: hypothetical protein HZC48_09125 [Nitrospirae bacterium]|nr:hypothetical protein [Nitrospirota bacterium]